MRAVYVQVRWLLLLDAPRIGSRSGSDFRVGGVELSRRQHPLAFGYLVVVVR